MDDAPFHLAYSACDLRARAQDYLRREAPDFDTAHETTRSDADLDPGRPFELAHPPRRAAVLIPVRDRPEGASVILTERSASMPSHPGQISFPGGRISHDAETAVEAALREAEEEIGLPADLVDVVGFLDPYLTGTGFLVAPVVAVIERPFTPRLDPREVASVFEVPFAFLMDPANHAIHERDIRGQRRRFYAMEYGERFIWGATAAILKNLYDRIYGR